MYRAFNITNCNWSDPPSIAATARQTANNKTVKAALESFVKDGILDGSNLSAHWFPTLKADVFISHAHADEQEAIKCSSWLKECFGLESFIDSCVWGHADDLLKIIDDTYCKNSGDSSYSYEKRNLSTSHIHMMLATAITEMLNDTECVFFINTANSITSNEAISKTKSPWLFYELGAVRTLQRNIPQRLRPTITEQLISFSSRKTAELKVEYNVRLTDLTQLGPAYLTSWQTVSAAASAQKLEALDLLYKKFSAKESAI